MKSFVFRKNNQKIFHICFDIIVLIRWRKQLEILKSSFTLDLKVRRKKKLRSFINYRKRQSWIIRPFQPPWRSTEKTLGEGTLYCIHIAYKLKLCSCFTPSKSLMHIARWNLFNLLAVLTEVSVIALIPYLFHHGKIMFYS